jgi:hypothetical protein
VPLAQRQLRKGRFSYVGEQADFQPFDDYTVDGLSLLVGAFCNIRTNEDTFATLLAQGKITPDIVYHILQGTTEQDTRYLRHVLASTPAKGFISGDITAERLSEESLSRVRVCFPPLKYRLAFTRFMDLVERAITETPAVIDVLLTLGDSLFAAALEEGSTKCRLEDVCHLREGAYQKLDAKLGLDELPVIAARGVIGSTAAGSEDPGHATPVTSGPALVAGRLGALLTTHWISEPCAPTVGTWFAEQSDLKGLGGDRLTLAILAFALRNAGAVKDPRETLKTWSKHSKTRLCQNGQSRTEGADDTRRIPDDLGKLPLQIPGAFSSQALTQRLEAILSAIRGLEVRRDYLLLLRVRAATLCLSGQANTLMLAPPAYPVFSGEPELKACSSPQQGSNPQLGLACIDEEFAPSVLSVATDTMLGKANHSAQGEAPAPSRSMQQTGTPIDRPDPIAHSNQWLEGEEAQGLSKHLAAVPAAVWDMAYGLAQALVDRGADPQQVGIGFPPPNQRMWATEDGLAAIAAWPFGTPPPNKANYAWIQEALLSVEGPRYTLMLVCNDALHTEIPSERPLREALAASGTILAVIALPGQIYVDGRPPASLLVLSSAGGADPCLMLDVSEQGMCRPQTSIPQEAPGLASSSRQEAPIAQNPDIPGADLYHIEERGGRVLPSSLVDGVVHAFRRFLQEGAAFTALPGSARAISLQELLANDCLLTPCSYLSPSDNVSAEKASHKAREDTIATGTGHSEDLPFALCQDVLAPLVEAQNEIDAYIQANPLLFSHLEPPQRYCQGFFCIP